MQSRPSSPWAAQLTSSTQGGMRGATPPQSALALLCFALACSSRTTPNASPGGGGSSAIHGAGATNAIGGSGAMGGAPATAGTSSGAVAGVGGSSTGGSVTGGGETATGNAGSIASGGSSRNSSAGASGDVAGASSTGGKSNSGGEGGNVVVAPAGTSWDSPSTGNPFLPGYFADPSLFYDPSTNIFYVFSTTDGVWIDYSSEPAVWWSKDFVHWHAQRLSLPSAWPKQPLWAPSVMKHPSNGHYYLIYAVGSAPIGTYIAQATSPLGPWTNATIGGASTPVPLYKKGEMFGNNDWFDAQFFVDGPSVFMTFGGGGSVGIAKLAFAADYSASIDNSDIRMTDGSTHKFKQLTGLSNYLEGSCMFKSGTRYFITYSNSACQNYNVQYAVGSSPVGPFAHAAGDIVQRDDSQHVLGPGHNSILQYENSTYIIYHRQPYQYVDVKRQVALNRITVNGDTLSSGAQNQSGVWVGSGALETLVASARARDEIDLAYGKPTRASSESEYRGGVSGNITETFPAIKGFYAARFAVDHNFGTRWAPTTLPGSLVVDLGVDTLVGRCETTFEYVLRAYEYRIDYLAQADAASASDAQASAAWHSYADRSTNTDSVSPIMDSKPVTARYLRLTVLAADLPTAQSQTKTIVQTDYADRVSVVEFKAFQSANPSAGN